MNLSNVRVGYSALSGDLFVYKHGNDNQVALNKREATGEIVTAAAQHIMHDCPKGAYNTVWIPQTDTDLECIILVMPKKDFNEKFGAII